MADRPGSPEDSLTYRDAGVDIDAGARLVDRIGDDVASTRRAEVIGDLGGFGGLFALDTTHYRQPVLVAATDGVGTKLKLANAFAAHDDVGVDLVAMCVNDVAVTGAEPLFFLDYYATGRLEVDTAARVVRGIAAGCRQAGCALIGGETAEMPGMYAPGDYDVAGFCVGAVERDERLRGEHVAPGDVILGLASSGPHANGYSLIRRVLEDQAATGDEPCGEATLAGALTAPTRIYGGAIQKLRAHCPVHGLAHITGGGLVENLPRVLPPGTRARLDARYWQRGPVFEWLQSAGGISTAEMLRTFNCGIGLCAIVPQLRAEAAHAELTRAGEIVYRIGVVEGSSEPTPDVAVEGQW
jgi:phosphoribosylformylglycinamidine cyclo-ligase